MLRFLSHCHRDGVDSDKPWLGLLGNQISEFSNLNYNFCSSKFESFVSKNDIFCFDLNGEFYGYKPHQICTINQQNHSITMSLFLMHS